MHYNFDELISRRGTNSVKWDSAQNPEVLPMWVADMDFRVAPAITDALERRVRHGVFGYTRVPDEYYQSVISWFGRRHGWQGIRKEWILYTSGVVPALSVVVKAFVQAGDKVLIQTPVYNCFFSSIRNNGCEAVYNHLVSDGKTYHIDFEDFEAKAADPAVKLFILCNPHNPAGRVWTREELQRMGDICLRHNVLVVADEIHCELVQPGHVYTPFASMSDSFLHNSVTCNSPTKAFNMAGLQIANIICADEERLQKIDRAININEVCDVNPFGVLALMAAYNEGEDWLDQLNAYLAANYRYMAEYCRKLLPQFPLLELEGTYLVWMNCSALRLSSEELEHDLIEKARLWLNAGTMYGPDGEGFMRWNIACPRTRLTEGLERFREYVKDR